MGNQNNQHDSNNQDDEQRRSDRLLKHMTTLCNMKQELIRELIKQMKKDSIYLEAQDFCRVEEILKRNVQKLVISFTKTESEETSNLSNLLNLSPETDFQQEVESLPLLDSISRFTMTILKSELDTLGIIKLQEIEALIQHYLFTQPIPKHQLNRTQPNSLSNFSHAFSIPTINSLAVPRVK